MADESANVAGEAVRAALELSVSASTAGFSVSLKIDNTILAGIVSVGALSLGAYYLANRRPVENAIRNGLEIRNGVVDPEVRNIEEGSILVELHCHSEHSFIQFVEDFEAKKVEHRLKEEFTKIGFRSKFYVATRNTEEVYRNVQMVRSLQKESKTKKVEDKEVQKASEEPPIRRAQSLPPYAEPVKRCGQEFHSPLPPYSAPAVEISYIAGNGPGRFNYSHGQGSRNIWKQPLIPEVSSQDHPEVVLTEDNVKKHFRALLISCSTGNDKEDKKHNTELRNLEGELEDSWDVVKRQAKCRVSNLIQTVHSFLMNPGESGKIVSFVYLAGRTVQINGENYLLPSDLKSPSSRADLMHSSLNINWLVKQLSENYMQVVIVDGAHENSMKDLNLNGVLQGLAPIRPPPNGIIAFPCPPGTIRPEHERLAYIKSVLKNLSEEPNLMLADLFEKVRADLASQSVSSPVEFSLTPSLLPICVNPENMQAGLCVDSSEDATYHAIIVSNANYEGRMVDTQQCMKDREQLRMALLKTGWKVELEACDEPGKDIMEELRNVLNKLGDDQKRVVMVYFMGYTKMIMDINYFFGSDFTAFATEPLRSSVPLQWALDLMCEKLIGKKILIVDDLNTSSRGGLAEMCAPLDVMISLPKGTRSDPNASFVNFIRKSLMRLRKAETELK